MYISGERRADGFIRTTANVVRTTQVQDRQLKM